MFGIGSTELVIILIVALVLIGPSKLPDLMKSLGKGISEFRRMSTDVKSTLEREIEKADEAKRVEETKKELFGDGEDKAEAKPEAPKAEGAPEAKAQVAATEQAQPAPAQEAKAQAEAPKGGDKPQAQEKSHA